MTRNRKAAGAACGALRRTAVALALAAPLLAAAPAHASTIALNYATGAASYQTAAGDKMQFSASANNGFLRLGDQGASSLSLTQLGGPQACAVITLGQIRCPLAGLTTMSAVLAAASGNFNDSPTSLATSLQAGPGGKTIETGSGDDNINVQNGSVDNVNCGAGNDVVIADPQDNISGTCETVIGQAAS